MDLARYSVQQVCDARHLATAYQVVDLAHNRNAVAWQFDIASATEQYQVWSAVYSDVTSKLGIVHSAYVSPMLDGYIEADSVNIVFPHFEASQTLEQRRGEVGCMEEQEVLHMLHDLLRALRDLHEHGLYLGVLQAKSVFRVELEDEGFRYLLNDPGVTRISLTMRPDGFDDFVVRNAQFCAPEGMYDLVLNETTDLYLCAQLAYYALAVNHPLAAVSQDEIRAFYSAHKGLDCGSRCLPNISGEFAVWLEKHLMFLPNNRETNLQYAIDTLPVAVSPRVSVINSAVNTPNLQTPVPAQMAPPRTTTMLQAHPTQGAGLLQSGMATHAPPRTTTTLQSYPAAGPVVVAGTPPMAQGPVVLESAKVGGGAKIWFMALTGLIVVAAVIAFIVSDAKIPKPVIIEDEAKNRADTLPQGDVLDAIDGSFNLSKWASHIKAHLPEISSIDPVIEQRPRILSIKGGERMTYEFIAYNASSVGSSSLMGARGEGTCDVAVKFEQYPSTKKYGVTWFGRRDAPYADAPSTFDKVVHLVFVFNGKSVVLYEDGVMKGEMDGVETVRGDKIGVGGIYTERVGKVDSGFGGDIFGFAVYNKALSVQEVAANYAAATGGN